MLRHIYSAACQVVRGHMDCPALDEDDYARRIVSLTGVCAAAIYTHGAKATGALVCEELETGKLELLRVDALFAGRYCDLDVHRAMLAVRKHYAQIVNLAWQLEKMPNAS